MLSNLPPGVNERDLPGSRPEDELYEFVFNQLPVSIQDEIEDNTAMGKELDKKLNQLIERLYDVIDLIQDMSYFEVQLIESSLEENNGGEYG